LQSQTPSGAGFEFGFTLFQVLEPYLYGLDKIEEAWLSYVVEEYFGVFSFAIVVSTEKVRIGGPELQGVPRRVDVEKVGGGAGRKGEVV
jgi:hypothetical protein